MINLLLSYLILIFDLISCLDHIIDLRSRYLYIYLNKYLIYLSLSLHDLEKVSRSTNEILDLVPSIGIRAKILLHDFLKYV